jgi:fibronectin type III domain protein
VHTPRWADFKSPARRCSGALLLLAIASLLIACGDRSTGTTGATMSNTGTLTWDAVTAENLSGYKIYFGTASGEYTQSVSVGNDTSYTLDGLSNQTKYYMAVTAFDTSGSESAYSNEVSKTIPCRNQHLPLGNPRPWIAPYDQDEEIILFRGYSRVSRSVADTLSHSPESTMES